MNSTRELPIVGRILARARAVEGDSDSPLRVAAANELYEDADTIEALYEALIDALSVCEYVLSKPGAYDEQFGQLVHAHVDAAKYALSRARGEQVRS